MVSKHVDPNVPESGNRQPNTILHRFFEKYYARGIVTHVENLQGTFMQIRIRSEAVANWAYIPGQHVRIQINDPLSLYGLIRPIETLRSYTIWEHCQERQEFELRVHLYRGNGIGLQWAQTVKAGDEVTFWGPQGDFCTHPSPYHLFIGEETASIAFAAMIQALGGHERIYGVLESDSRECEVPIPGSHEIYRVYRNGGSPVASSFLLEGLKKAELPEQEGTAYVAGEARTCLMIRDYLIRERKWPRKAVIVRPFWTPNKRGLH